MKIKEKERLVPAVVLLASIWIVIQNFFSPNIVKLDNFQIIAVILFSVSIPGLVFCIFWSEDLLDRFSEDQFFSHKKLSFVTVSIMFSSVILSVIGISLFLFHISLYAGILFLVSCMLLEYLFLLSSTTMAKENYRDKEDSNSWKKIGECSVDSGQLMITDPCYEVKNVSTGNKPSKQFSIDGGSGVVFSTGDGDGVYDVYGLIKNKTVREIKMKFE